MVLTSSVLYVVPVKVYQHFFLKSTDSILPMYWQLLSPSAFLFGGLTIYNVFSEEFLE
jgi:hypothetical protein